MEPDLVSSPHALSAPPASLRPHMEAGLGATGEKLSGVLVPGWVSGHLVSNPILTSDPGPVTCLLRDSSLKAAVGGEGRTVERAQGGNGS